MSIAAEKDEIRSQRSAVRWNLTVLTMDVTFFAFGMAFLDSGAVLPLLLHHLGATGPIIGSFSAIRALVFNVVQIFVAYATHWNNRQKPWLVRVALTTRLPLLLYPLFLIHAADSPAARAAALLATFVILNIWVLGDGLGYVPWMEMVARAFTDRTRGRFFGTTQLCSGIGAIVIAFVVHAVLRLPRLPYPMNYALLAGAAAIMFQISMAGVLLIREPATPESRLNAIRPPLSTYLTRIPALVKESPVFARLAAVQLLIGFGAASAPFYVLYAIQRYRLSDAWGGTYQMCSAISVVLLTPLWAILAERKNPAVAVRCLALTCVLTPVAALTIGALSPWMFCTVFLLMGGSLGWGMWIVMNHYLLSHVAEDERSIYIALINLLFVPSALFPYFGGLLLRNDRFINIAGHPLVFVVTSVVTLCGFIMALQLPAIDG